LPFALDRAEPPAGSHPDAATPRIQATATASARRHRLAMTAPSTRPTRSSASRPRRSRTAPARQAWKARSWPRTPARTRTRPGCQPGQAGRPPPRRPAAPVVAGAITSPRSGWPPAPGTPGRRPSGRARRPHQRQQSDGGGADRADHLPQGRGPPGSPASRAARRSSPRRIGSRRPASRRRTAPGRCPGSGRPNGAPGRRVVGPTGVQLATDPLRDRLDMGENLRLGGHPVPNAAHRQASRSEPPAQPAEPLGELVGSDIGDEPCGVQAPAVGPTMATSVRQPGVPPCRAATSTALPSAQTRATVRGPDRGQWRPRPPRRSVLGGPTGRGSGVHATGARPGLVGGRDPAQ